MAGDSPNQDRRKELVALLGAVFGSELGHKALDALRAHAGMKSDPFDAASDRRTAYNLGRQSVVRWIENHLAEHDK